MTNNYQKEIQTKLTKGLLDMIILQFLDEQPMHGYQIITKTRKTFGIYFGPSTIYPLLGNLRKERLPKKHLEHGQRTPKKSLPTNKRRRNSPQLHRRLTQHNMQNHDNRQQNPNRGSTNNPNGSNLQKRGTRLKALKDFSGLLTDLISF